MTSLLTFQELPFHVLTAFLNHGTDPGLQTAEEQQQEVVMVEEGVEVLQQGLEAG